MSAIHKAAIAGDIRRMERLISQGADLAFHDEKDGFTPLMATCLSAKSGVDALRLLLDHGSDIHACGKRDCHFGEQLVSLAVRSASIEKIRLLLERGAKLDPPSQHGYTLLTLAACRDQMDVFDLLLDAGAPIDGRSSYGESALSVLSRNGRFAQIGKLLAAGADPEPLKWCGLHRAIALGSVEEIAGLLDAGADIEERDWWERTPFLLAIRTGAFGKVELLLERGADRDAKGRCGETALQYPVNQDDGGMMGWLVDEGFDIEAEDEHGHTALMDAVEQSAVACFRVLIEAGADWERSGAYGDSLIQSASHPEIICELIVLGADPSELEADEIRQMIGLGTLDELPISKEDFTAGRTQRSGTANPERMNVPFWDAMVRNGWSGYQAANLFGISPYGEAAESGVRNPVWSHDRFGMSLTILPDGRFAQIAGEHEDGYDPDFCIYNHTTR